MVKLSEPIPDMDWDKIRCFAEKFNHRGSDWSVVITVDHDQSSVEFEVYLPVLRSPKDKILHELLVHMVSAVEGRGYDVHVTYDT